MPRKHNVQEFNELARIRSDLHAFFNQEGFPIRIIYRTCQAKFGKESPGNLVPGKLNPSRITIYLDFEENIQSETLTRIIAFQEKDAEGFPKLMSRFSIEKIDLERMSANYVFSDLNDLKKNYRRIVDLSAQAYTKE